MASSGPPAAALPPSTTPVPSIPWQNSTAAAAILSESSTSTSMPVAPFTPWQNSAARAAAALRAQLLAAIADLLRRRGRHRVLRQPLPLRGQRDRAVRAGGVRRRLAGRRLRGAGGAHDVAGGHPDGRDDAHPLHRVGLPLPARRRRRRPADGAERRDPPGPATARGRRPRRRRGTVHAADLRHDVDRRRRPGGGGRRRRRGGARALLCVSRQADSSGRHPARMCRKCSFRVDNCPVCASTSRRNNGSTWGDSVV